VPLLEEDVFQGFFVGACGVFADGRDHGSGFVELDLGDGVRGFGGWFGEVEGCGLQGV
jgi:hypothetical protein